MDFYHLKADKRMFEEDDKRMSYHLKTVESDVRLEFQALVLRQGKIRAATAQCRSGISPQKLWRNGMLN